MTDQMRDRDWIDAVRDRVLDEVRATPSVRPYLGEEDRRPTRVRAELSEAEREQKRRERAEYKRRWREERTA